MLIASLIGQEFQVIWKPRQTIHSVRNLEFRIISVQAPLRPVRLVKVTETGLIGRGRWKWTHLLA
jgi:hypothetical protein